MTLSRCSTPLVRSRRRCSQRITPVQVRSCSPRSTRNGSLLVLANTWAKVCRDTDYPQGIPRALAARWVDQLEHEWAADPWRRHPRCSYYTPTGPVLRGRHKAATPGRQLVRAQSWPSGGCCSMRMSGACWKQSVGRRWSYIDLATSSFGPLGRYLAEHIRGATFFAAPGEDHSIIAEPVDELLDEIQDFLTGIRRHPTVDRVLSTVVFSDIVKSTDHAASMGDLAWRQLLDRYDTATRRLLGSVRRAVCEHDR